MKIQQIQWNLVYDNLPLVRFTEFVPAANANFTYTKLKMVDIYKTVVMFTSIFAV